MSDEDRVNITLQSVFGISKIGLRPKDEDYIVASDILTDSSHNLEVAILLDGMGGGAAGEKASQNAGLAFIEVCEILGAGLSPESEASERHAFWLTCVKTCNMAVEQVAKQEGGRSGTTLTAVIVMRDGAGLPAWGDLVHVGDTRAYVGSGKEFVLHSEDHSMTGEMLRAGYIKIHEIEKTHGHNVLTMSLGGPDELIPQIIELDLFPGDEILLCCDGVWGPLHSETGLWVPQSDDRSKVIEMMVDEALSRGSKDNCSALIWSL